MTNRIIEIGETGAFVRLKNKLVEINLANNVHGIPAEEIGVLLLANPAITVTQNAMTAIIESGGMIVLCGSNYLPVGMVLPFASHSNAARNYEAQVNAGLPLKKQIWKEIIRKKIIFQSELLTFLNGNDNGLKALSLRIESGDVGNVEGMAARVYWQELFPKGFRRDHNALDQNRYLNYGYTVLRACTVRAICSAGLHPSFGIHHHNQYDAFRLADDIMEPFRPMVDRKVIELLKTCGIYDEMHKNIKKKLLEILDDSVKLNGKSVSIFDALASCSVSILDIFEKKRKKILLPDSLFIS